MGFTSPCSIPRITRPLGKGYEWVCFIDPLGCFRSNFFRISDIETPAKENCSWLEGTAFLNIFNRKIKVIRNGRVVDIMQIRCKCAWSLYKSFCDLSELVHTDKANPELQRTYMKSLNELREHLKNCPDCKRGFNVAFSNSKVIGG